MSEQLFFLKQQSEPETSVPAENTARPFSLCFVALSAYPTLSGRNAYAGGIEWQQSLTARWLAARGHRVSMITWDEGQPDGECIDGVRIWKTCARDAGIRGLRFLTPRWTALCKALRRADADLYYHNCGEYVTGQVALWCGRAGRRFVYSVASDRDCDPRLPDKSLRERMFYRYGLRKADVVIAQTHVQQRLLAAGFGRAAHVFPMPCPGPPYFAAKPSDALPPRRVAWVGRLAPVKRLELLFEVAATLPDVEFEVAGDAQEPGRYVQGLRDAAARLPNVTLLGRIPREAVRGLYRRAACLCCTSTYEGFPNTFLEAWSEGCPVVSTVDPDGLIAGRGLGAVAASGPELVSALRRLLQAPAEWQAAARRAREYWSQHHLPDRVLPRFERLFADLVDGRVTSGLQPTPSYP
jgi:glycosyltransferase involved in cell wall biosynthesis